MRKNIFIICYIILSTNITFAQEETAKDILDKLSEKGKSYSDITVKFSYHFENTKEMISENMNGEAWIKGEMYKLNMGEELSIINNGETLWYFMKDIPEVQIMKNDPEDQMSPSKIFMIYEKNYQYKYNGTNDKVHSISLYPKSESEIEMIQLAINAEEMIIIQIKIYDKDQGITIYNITDFITNLSIDNDLFKFVKEDHPDVEIIDLR